MHLVNNAPTSNETPVTRDSATAETAQLDTFTRAYIECALWSSMDNADQGGEPLDANYSVSDIAPEALAEIVSDCAAFQRDESESLTALDSAQSGHDFWLTRNHHGAGFWDRGLGDLGRKLTDAAHAWGSCDIYVGDDGKLHI